MEPVSIKKISDKEIHITWSDGHVSPYTFVLLRDLCPCAGCAGETLLFASYVPPPPDLSVPGHYELKNINPIGSYAVQLVWGDGHNTGIYTWDHLITNCPCPQHNNIRQNNS